MIRQHFGSILIALSILCASAIYACAHRYSYHRVDDYHTYVFDNWTGRYESR